MADNSLEIADLEAILNSGSDLITIDGNTTRWNLKEVRKRLVELKATDDATTAKRHRLLTVNLRDDS